MNFVEGIPVKSNGVQIGNARLYEDGTVEMEIHASGRELFHHVRDGLQVSFAISTEFQMATPPPQKDLQIPGFTRY